STRCMVCEAGPTSPRFSIERVSVHECRSCGSWSARERTPASETSSQFYDTIDAGAYRTYLEPFRSVQYRNALAAIKPPAVARRSLVDVGASFGWLVRVARELGWDATGIEPATIDVEADVRPYV